MAAAGAGGSDLADLLERWRGGDATAFEALVREVYPVLRALAQRRLSQHGAVTLSATELAHEAYIGLLCRGAADFRNRGHFFAVAAHAIRRLLIDHLRERGAVKRGGDLARVTLDAAADVPAEERNGVDVLALDAALVELEGIDARAARVVELRYFGGLTIEEAAAVTGWSTATVKRSWQFARAWMHDRLRDAHS